MSHSSLNSASSQAATKPFAMIRHDFASDPRLSASDVLVMLALMYWCRDKSYCWPCTKSICERVHKKERAVQIALKNLEHFGYVRFEKDSYNKTGRRIVLTWKADGAIAETKDGDSPRSKYRERSTVARSAYSAPQILAIKGEADSSPCDATEDLQKQHVGIVPLEITLQPISDADREDDDTISDDRKRTRAIVGLSSLAVRRGRDQAVAVDRAAHLIAGLLMDEHSLDFHRAVCWKVAKGKIAAELVREAFAATYDKIVERGIDTLGSYYHGCLRNMIGHDAMDEFAREFNLDRERAKREYACQDINLIGDVA